MKNIHLIPTDKPSRLWTNNLKRRLELDEFPSQHDFIPTNIAKHIYITSDEEIKDVRQYNGEWQLEKGQLLNKFPVYLSDLSECKLVIMTTDQDLIADGVQPIDDDFLEWFVKNPSCEEVKVVYSLDTTDGISVFMYSYKIILPKKEITNKINLVEIPQEQLEKERNPNYEYFSIDEPKTSQLPGVNVDDVKPSNPQMVKENFSPQVDKQRMYSEEQLKLAYMQGYNRGADRKLHDMESYIEFIKQNKKT